VHLCLGQNGGASRAQYSRWLASSVVVERSPVDRRPIPVVVIEHASTSGAFNSFIKNLFCVFFSVVLIVHTFLASATVVPSFLFLLISVFLLFTVFALVCPGADKLDIYTLFLSVWNRQCVRRQLVCKYPAKSYRGCGSSRPKAAA
jgi:hypothetical protein